MWMLALLGMLGVTLAANRREQRGPTPVRDELAAAREAGTLHELRESLQEEGAAIIAARRPAEVMALEYPIALPDPISGMPLEALPYPVLNGTDVVTSADRASVRRMSARAELLDRVHANAAWA